MTAQTEPIKLAIIGSGAIAERGYLPAASQMANITVTHVVDLDLQRAEEVADRYGIPNALTDYRKIFSEAHAAVVATPPESHARISQDCMNHGLHVLCEKPLAVSVAEAGQMVATQQRTGTHLAVGMVRRLSRSARMLKTLHQTGALGNIDRFEIEEGWEFNWPLRTGYMFQGNTARGVIADTGTHLIDLILWILGGPEAEVISCRDDNWGGVEANAIIEIRLEVDSHSVDGRIELSFTRRLRNTMKIFSDAGCIEAAVVGDEKVIWFPKGGLDDKIVLRSPPRQPLQNDAFVLQLSNFADSIANGTPKYVSAAEALKTMTLIDACYRIRHPMVQSWEKVHLESFFGGHASE